MTKMLLFVKKFHPAVQGVLMGLMITMLIMICLPPVVMFLRWWFEVWGI